MKNRHVYLFVATFTMIALSACSGSDGSPAEELAGTWAAVEEGEEARFVFTDTTVSFVNPERKAVRAMELSTHESGLFSVYLPGIDRYSYVKIMDDSTAVWVSREDYRPLENPEAVIAGEERPNITKLILRRSDASSSR